MHKPNTLTPCLLSFRAIQGHRVRGFVTTLISEVLGHCVCFVSDEQLPLLGRNLLFTSSGWVELSIVLFFCS